MPAVERRRTVVGRVDHLSLPTTAAAAADRTCYGQAATIVGTTGDDTLTGTSGPDVIVGLSGSDTTGRDKVSITAGTATADLGDGPDDLLVSDSGTADVQLGGGADQLRMAAIRDGAVAHLGAGDDQVASSNLRRLGLQTLYGGSGQHAARLVVRHFACHSIEQGTFPG